MALYCNCRGGPRCCNNISPFNQGGITVVNGFGILHPNEPVIYPTDPDALKGLAQAIVDEMERRKALRSRTIKIFIDGREVGDLP